MSNNVTIELDFTGKTPAGGSGLGYLESGLNQATILEFKHYEESNRLYVYLGTDGVRHRESFSLVDKAIPFIMGFLVSAGVSEDKLASRVKFPFHKLVGKTVYFKYTAPTMGQNGQPVEGSYPEYRFMQEFQYDQVVGTSTKAPKAKAKKAEVSNGSVGKALPASPPVAGEEDFAFLMDD